MPPFPRKFFWAARARIPTCTLFLHSASAGGILRLQRHVSIQVYFGAVNGILDRLFCLAPGALGLALRPAEPCLQPGAGIVSQLARLALDASGHFGQSCPFTRSLFTGPPPWMPTLWICGRRRNTLKRSAMIESSRRIHLYLSY